MQNIDPYSYQCGVIDCFNEMVRSGVKALALSHPMDSAAERDALIPFARSCCHQYGNQLYIEDTPLLTDLFPLSLNQGKFNILFYRAGHILDQYLRLKERKANLVAERAYFGGNRSQLAWCLRPDNAIRNHANQIMRYFDTVHFACPDPIDKDISYGLGFNFVSFPPVPIHGFQNLRLFLFRDVFQSFNRRLGIAFLSAIRFISSNGHTHIGSHS